MSDTSQKATTGSQAVSPSTPRSLALAAAGVKTGGEFAALMSALMTDLISGEMTPQVGNAVCCAGGKLLKVVEMQHKYGKTPTQADAVKVLTLVP